MPFRTHPHGERIGMDLHELGSGAYPEFVMHTDEFIPHSQPMNPSATLEPGQQLDHYRIDAHVAESGMASIYRATDLRDGRQVAIKLPHAGAEADPSLFERFRREEEIGAALDHPGVMRTFPGRDGVAAVPGDGVGAGTTAAAASLPTRASCRRSAPCASPWAFWTRWRTSTGAGSSTAT